MGWVWDLAGVTLTDKFVLMALADAAEDDGTRAFPGVETIATKISGSRRTVQRSLRDLEGMGLITASVTWDERGRQKSTRYDLNLAWKGEGVNLTPRGDIHDVGRHRDAPGGVSLTPRRASQRRPSKETRQIDPSEDPSERHVQSGSVGHVFEAWKTATGRNGTTLLTPKRRRCVQARLREGYSPDELVAAVRGVSRSPFHLGQNDRHQRYDDLTVILRDGGQVEKFRDLEQGDGPPDMLDAVIAEIFAEKAK